jgi:hypothetical protein
MFWQALSVGPAVDAYRQAPPCAGNEALSGCYQVLPMTVESFQVQTHRGGNSATVSIALPAEAEQVYVPNLTYAAQDVLADGVSGTAKIYQGDVTLLVIHDVQLETDKNPLGQQSRDQEIAVIALATGALMLVLDQFRRRRRTAAMVIPGIPSMTTIGEPSIGLPVVLRPQLRNNSSQLLVACGAIALGTPALFVQIHPRGQGVATFWFIAAAVIALFIGMIGLTLINSRLTFDGMTLERTDQLGRTRTIQRDEIGRLALRTVISGRSSVRQIVIVGKEGRALLTVAGNFLDSAGVARLAAAMNVPADPNWDQVVTPGQLRAEFPGSASWVYAHARVIGAGLAVVLVAVFTLIALAGQGH